MDRSMLDRRPGIPDSSRAALTGVLITGVGGIVGQLARRADLRGLLFRSGKPGQFIAGADLKELGALAYAPREMVEQAIGAGHPADWARRAAEWRQLGVTHLSINTMKAGLASPQQHIDAVLRWKQTVETG